MAKKKTYGSSRAFTEGHLEVLGDQSEVTNPSPSDGLSDKQRASYAKQRAYNAQPWSVRKGNDIYAQDQQFSARLKRWEAKQGQWSRNSEPKPVDYGKDRGGNEYKAYNAGGSGGGQGGAPTGTAPANRVDQARWKAGRDGSPLTKKQQLQDQREAGALTKREIADQRIDQYASNQPLARNELKEGIQGNFGSLGNFFNRKD